MRKKIGRLSAIHQSLFKPQFRKSRSAAACQRRRRLLSEKLEDRRLLAVITPTTFDDQLDGGDTSSIMGLELTPGSDGISLREAVIAANNTPGVDTINLSAGTYSLTQSGAFEESSATGDLDITESLQINGVIGSTIVDADGLFDRVFDVRPGAGSFELSGVEVTGGLLPSSESMDNRSGGGLRNDFSTTVVISDSSFYDNRSTNDPPAGEYSRGGALLLRGNATVQRTSFIDNVAASDGGAILAEGTTSVITITDSYFSGNHAPGGGAIYSNADITINSSTFTGNTTAWNYGGGGGAGSGGAIEMQSGALLTATNITVSGNTSGSGGGIALLSANADIYNSTIVNNHGDIGGGVYVSPHFTPSVLQLKDSIVALNTADTTGPNVDGAVMSLRNNVVGSTLGSTGFGAGDIFVLDPRLGDLADNGGPVPTHALLLGSPAIDAGSDDPPATDARGTARPFRAKGDVGAFESTDSLNQDPTADDDSATVDEDGTLSIDVLSNDSDPENYPLSVTITGHPSLGTATVNSDQSIQYTPTPNFSGSDTITYRISDGLGGLDTASVQITITSINDAPVAGDDSYTVQTPNSITMSVFANDTDIDSAGFQLDSFTQPSGGVVSVDGNGDLVYQPSAGFDGTDTFSYTLVDTEGLISNAATVTIDVQALPSVSGLLFDDLDADGVQSAGEGPRVGLMVYADLNGDGVFGFGEPSTVTDASGSFTLPDLPVGDTLIRVNGVNGETMTGPATAIPRLFVSTNQEMRELNVINGSVIDTFSLQTSAAFGAEPSGTAFDGNYVYVYDGFVDNILVFDPDIDTGSNYVATIPLSVSNSQNYSGLAVIGTTLFALEQNADVISTIQLNLADLAMSSPGPTFDIPLVNSDPTQGFPYNLATGLGESADGTKLVVSTWDNVKLELDPTTGVITNVLPGVNANDVSAGIAGASGRLFAGRASAFGIRVFDDSGNRLRTMGPPQVAYDLAAGPSDDVGTILNLQSGQHVTNLVFGLASPLGSVSGTQFADANENGQFDSDELPIEGATVFADLNNNLWPDADEPRTTSGSDGGYTLSDVPSGVIKVRSILPDGYAPGESFAEDDRLFAAMRQSNSGGPATVRIVEVDPVNGSVIRDVVSDVIWSFDFDIAFDGHQLIGVDNNLDLIHEFTIDGQLLDTTPLGQPDGNGSFRSVDNFGTAVVGDSVITVGGNPKLGNSIGDNVNGLQIRRFNPDTNTFDFLLPISFQPNQQNGPVTPTRPDYLATTVGLNAAGTSLELFDDNGTIQMSVDLQTGEADFTFATSTGVVASESVGGESFYAFYGGRINVYDSADNFLRSLPSLGSSGGQGIFGLAGGTYRDNAITAVVDAGFTTTDINHASQTSLATISGNVATNPAGQIAEVYLDLNNNSAFDPGETSVLTDSSGNYVFDDVVAGTYQVQQVTPANQTVRAVTDDAARLFTLSHYNVTDQSTITEFDIESGETINSFPAPGPNAFSGMASRNGRLYVARHTQLYELDANTGTVLNTVDISIGTNPVRHDGLAILGSIAYLHETNSGTLRRYDLDSRTFLSSFDLAQLNPGYGSQYGGLSESADGVSLVITSGQNAFSLDPATGLFIEDLGVHFTRYAMAGAAGKWFEPGFFVTSNPNKTVSIRDADAFLLRNLPIQVNGFVDAMAAETVQPSGHRVTLFGSETKPNVDFVNLPSSVNVSGTQFIDANGNGVFDSGESPIVGATVFVDFNHNQWPDAGEPKAISGADGSYTIDDVPAGTHSIRAITDSGSRPADTYSASNRLFAIAPGEQIEGPSFSMRIVELNPTTGQVISDIDTGLPVTYNSEATFDGDRIVVIDDRQDIVYELTTNGQLIHTGSLSDFSDTVGGFPPVDDFGPTFIGDSIVSLRYVDNQLFLATYDTSTHAFENRLQVSIDWQAGSLEEGGPNSWPTDFVQTVGRAPDGTSIVIYNSRDNRTLTVDPRTGIGTLGTTDFSGFVSPGFQEYEAYESIDGTIYRSRTGGEIEVIDPFGNELLPWSVPFFTFGLGGAVDRDNAVSISVDGSQALSDIDHAWTSTLAILQGNVSSAGSSGPIDLYLDVNHNRQFDAGEPTATTDSDGDYRFDDVQPGDFQVRAIPPAGKAVYASAPDDSIVYYYHYDSQTGTGTFHELDSFTGQTHHSFSIPDINFRDIGLAAHGGKLYVTQQSMLYEVDPVAAQIVHQVPLSSYDYTGLAVIDSTLYMQKPETGELASFDLLTRQWGPSLDLPAINPASFITNNDLHGLGEAGDGQNLLTPVFGRPHLLDPQTGLMTVLDLDLFSSGPIGGANFVWHDIAASSSGSGRTIQFREPSGFVSKQVAISSDIFVSGIGAQSTLALSHRVSVYGGETITSLDFNSLVNSGTITGTLSVDGDLPLEGATVFVDANANDWPDAGEIQTASAADGTYTLSGVPFGETLVRSLPGPNLTPATVRETTDRLFATRGTAQPGDTFDVLEIVELDPLTGVELASALTDIPVTPDFSTAYDGRQLIVVDNTLEVLYQVAVDGTLIDETPLPFTIGTTNSVSVYGTAVLGGTIYLLTSFGFNNTALITFDSETKSFGNPKPVTNLYLPTNPSAQLSPTLTASADGTSLLAFDRNNGVYKIDVATGRMTEVLEDPDLWAVERGAASTGGETFVLSLTQSGIRVYDSNWQFQRNAPNFSPRYYRGLGGGQHQDGGAIVTVDPTDATLSTDVNFGFRSTLAQVSGTIIEDMDRDGVATNEDQPKVGAQVFVDTNRNGVLDGGETVTLTDDSGNYTIDGLMPGDHAIRVVLPSDQRAEANSPQTRLFATDSSQSGPTMIREHDPITGQPLRSFPAPLPAANLVGLALDANGLYYASDSGLWLLDPDSGATHGFVELPTVVHSGAAVAGGHVFVLSPSGNILHKVNPITQTLVATFDLHAINSVPGSVPPGTLDNLSASFDGTRLLASSGSQMLSIDPDTGMITDLQQTTAISSGAGVADGERYVARNITLDVVDQAGARIRFVLIGYQADSIAVAVVPATRHLIYAEADTDVAGADFLVQTGFAPSDINLSTNSINENVDTSAADVVFAELSTVDASTVDSHTYELIDGAADDNARFLIDGNELKLRQGEVLDFESQASYQIRLRSTDAIGQSHEKEFTLDVNDLGEFSGVIINNDAQSFSRSRITSLRVEFDGDVEVAPDAFTIFNRTTEQTFQYSFEPPTISDGKTVVVLNVVGAVLVDGSLNDGNYELSIDATKVTSLTGAGLDANRDGIGGDDYYFGRDESDRFYRLFGDTSGDRSVGLTDFGMFRVAFGSNADDASFDETFDSNDDGIIGLADFGAFRNAFGDDMNFDL